MTMTITQQIITVVVVVLGTMTTRFLPFIIFPGGKEPPAVITYLGKVLPCAVIGLLVVFCLKDVTEEEYIAQHRRGNGVLYGAGADHIWLVRNM